MEEELRIRKLTHLDWIVISSIYKEGVFVGNATFESRVPSWYQWNRDHHGQCRFVAELNEKVVAFGAISEYSSSLRFSGVAQLEIYVSQAYQNLGIGIKLLGKIIQTSEDLEFWSIQTQIFNTNKKAINFLQKLNFRVIGEQKMIIHKNETWQDIILLERRSQVIGYIN